MTDRPLSNEADLTVSQLSGAIKRTLEDRFDRVRVRGELGRVTFHRNGHIYLDLKDEKASIAGVVWRGQASRLGLKPEEGLEVIATGRITSYAPQSKYQLVIERMEVAGEGALMALLEKRKKQLAAEGLFAEERKRPLPYLPAVIGVITSPTGAVIRDILHRLNDRFPRHVLLWPVMVQGEKSAGEVSAAIQGFNNLSVQGLIPKPDVLIVARGGGSLEDLWGFNEEIVARAAAASDIPLISAVGHETDTTLIDYVADRRAPTPTAAAEMAVPVRAELIADVLGLERRLVQSINRVLTERSQLIVGLGRGLPRAEDLIANARQRFDTWADRLPLALKARAQTARAAFANLLARLRPNLLSGMLDQHRQKIVDLSARSTAAINRLPDEHNRKLSDLGSRLERAMLRQVRDMRQHTQQSADMIAKTDKRLHAAMAQLFEQRRNRIDASARLLNTLSFEGTLERGFALVLDADQNLLRSAEVARAAQDLTLRFAGAQTVDAHTKNRPSEQTKPANKSKSSAKPKTRADTVDRQGRLL